MDLISVILPVYNGAQTLEGMVRSVMGQTWKALELILVDDGSEDGTAEICRRLAAEDDRIRVFCREHRGVSAARNFGLSRATGVYIAFVDADDLLPPEYLQMLQDAATGADAAVCDVAAMDGQHQTGRWACPEGMLSRREALRILLERRQISTGPCGKLFRRELLRDLEFPPMRAYEDILFVAKAFGRAERISVTNRTEYRYLSNPAGTMASFARKPTADLIRATEMLLALAVGEKLGDGAVYATVSHLMQVAQSAAGNREFLQKTRLLYRRHLLRILRCGAFGWKERVYYLRFALFGIL